MLRRQTAPSKKSKRMPRAIAVLEMLPGGGTRLVPVALWMDGKYYDASLYGANPEPFVLQPGTVYEAQNYGETAGTFVVQMPKQVGGNWIADGQWKPYGALDAKIAAEKAKHPAAKPKDNKAIFTGGPDEGPPVLHRAGAGDSTQKTDTTASQRRRPGSQRRRQDKGREARRAAQRQRSGRKQQRIGHERQRRGNNFLQQQANLCRRQRPSNPEAAFRSGRQCQFQQLVVQFLFGRWKCHSVRPQSADHASCSGRRLGLECVG